MNTDIEAHRGSVKNVQLDETCFGRRKYGRGKSVSANGQQWAQVAVATQNDGFRTRRIFVLPVGDRSTATLRELPDTLLHRYGVIRTDSWRGSRFLTRERRAGHMVVNHAEGFCTTCPNTGARVHTNHVESANGMLKAEQRRRFRLGKNREKRQLRIQAQGVLANGRLREMASSPFAEALLAVKTMAALDPDTGE